MAATVIYITTPGSGFWPVPSDWNPANNTIEAIGGGAAGNFGDSTSSGGGGGGAYAKSTNVFFSVGANITYQVAPTAASTVAGSDTWISSTGSAPTLSSQGVLAKGGALGVQGTNGAGGLGGASGSCIGSTANSGGAGGAAVSNTGGGGGGAGGFNGVGVAGTSGATTSAGGAGDNGSGGAGGTTSTAGSPGTEWTTTGNNGSTAGSGGGGGGQSSAGGGGLYGAGGGSGGVANGTGAQGIIIITYIPAPIPDREAFTPAPNPILRVPSPVFITWTQNTRIATDTFFGVSGQPPANLDWPNPKGYIPGSDLKVWGQPSTTLLGLLNPALTAVPPFYQTNWPVPTGYQYPSDLRVFFNAIENNLLGKDTFFGVPGQAPANLDWPVPKGYVPVITQGTWTQNNTLVLNNFILNLHLNFDWPNPRGYVPSIDLKTWIQSQNPNLQDKFFGLAGHPTYDFPNPRGYVPASILSTWIDPLKLNLQHKDAFFGLGGPRYDYPNPRGYVHPNTLLTSIQNAIIGAFGTRFSRSFGIILG